MSVELFGDCSKYSLGHFASRGFYAHNRKTGEYLWKDGTWRKVCWAGNDRFCGWWKDIESLVRAFMKSTGRG